MIARLFVQLAGHGLVAPELLDWPKGSAWLQRTGWRQVHARYLSPWPSTPACPPADGEEADQWLLDVQQSPVATGARPASTGRRVIRGCCHHRLDRGRRQDDWATVCQTAVHPVRTRAGNGYGLAGPVAAGGRTIEARRLVRAVEGMRMRPRVGRSRSKVTSSSEWPPPAHPGEHRASWSFRCHLGGRRLTVAGFPLLPSTGIG
jgi:hypothetical protein